MPSTTTAFCHPCVGLHEFFESRTRTVLADSLPHQQHSRKSVKGVPAREWFTLQQRRRRVLGAAVVAAVEQKQAASPRSLQAERDRPRGCQRSYSTMQHGGMPASIHAAAVCFRVPGLMRSFTAVRLHRDYLTGFSKRKQAKKDAGRLRAEAKEREERLQLRQQVSLRRH